MQKIKKYHIITYGCQMNVHESEKLAGMLEARGFLQTDDQTEADVIAINTCCIRQNAENRALGNLGYIKKIKEQNPSLIVCVFGCMTQAKGAAQELKERCPFINIIFGTHNLYKFDEYLTRAQNGEKILEISETEDADKKEKEPVKRTSGVNAWVNIMYGCDNYCTYCIVPFVRGRERSREPEKILDEVKKILASGYKEITLLGQNVNSYKAVDKEGNAIDFAKLLEQIAVLPYKFRVRFMTSHPKDLSDDVIKTIAEHPNLPDYFHLPVQSGSDHVLKLMNRKYTAEHYLNRVETIRKYMPDAGFSSDIMVGFPGESEQDFEDTLTLIEKVKYHNLFMFIYSPRKGTKAAEMDGQIEKSVVDPRFKRLLDLQAKIGNQLAEAVVGKEVEVLCDTYDEKTDTYRGKTTNGKIVSFKSDTNLYGQFVLLKITSSKNSNLLGEIV